MTKQYDASSIKLLKFPESIRLRPGMYIGSTEPLSDGTNPAFYQLTKEVLDNSLDEVLSKNANEIEVEYDSKKREITIWDNGRGIPVDYHKEFGTSTLVGVFSNMHASGKFDKDSYETSIGLNGVGTKCVNALSKYFEVYTCRNKKWYTIRFEKGVLKQDVTEITTIDRQRGTGVKFSPDSSIIPGILDFEKLRDTCVLLSHLIKVKISLTKDGKRETFEVKEGISAYLNILCNKHHIDNPNFLNKLIIDKDSVSLSMGWIDQDVNILESYVNASQTSDGGTHVKGLQKAIIEAFHDQYKKANFDLQDISTGLVCVLAKNVSDVKFNSQTKEKLITKEAEEETYNIVYPELIKWIKQNKEFCDDLVAKAEQLKAIRNKSSEDRALLKAIKGKRGKSGMPVGLQFATATSKNWEEKVLYIVEGKSAAGGCKRVRDPKIHEICGLRGKIMNAFKDKKSLLESEEVANILKFIGYGSGEWRVGKTVLFADSDVDGENIQALVLAVLLKVVPDYVKEGRVYICNAPLFAGHSATKTYYGASLNDLYQQCPKGLKSITRMKGWGECLSFDSYLYTSEGLISYQELRSLFQNISKANVGLDNRFVIDAVQEKQKTLLSIKNRDGFVQKVSPDHTCVILREGNIIECKAEDIKLGDYMIIRRGINCFGKYECTKEIARIVGHLMADGNCSTSNFSCCDSIDSDYQKDLYNTLAALGCTTIKHSDDWKRVRLNTCYSDRHTKDPNAVNVLNALKNFGLEGKTAWTKEVPLQIRRAPKEIQAEFLKCYIGRDGGIVKKSDKLFEIELTTVSEKLSEQIQLMLLNFGILASRIRAKEGGYNPEEYCWELHIHGAENMKLYRENIGFISKWQQDRLNDAASRNIFSSKACIPGLKDRWKSILKALPRQEKANLPKITIAKEISLQTIKKYWLPKLDRVESISREIAELLKYTIDNNLYFSPVTSITKIDGLHDVFDFFLDKDHRFVAQGCITHNCTDALLRDIAFSNKSTFTQIKYDDHQLDSIIKIMGDDVAIRKGMLNDLKDE